ncbi:hypothetical protein [Amycolatopsis sp. cmx-11-12]|uniref:hypothetical protein n=1 Tax=Amycolatopsis sp. cmx-11-12 TaxID=2785795 RepID=UPI0039174003
MWLAPLITIHRDDGRLPSPRATLRGRAGPRVKNSGVKTVSNVAELRTLFDHWTTGAQKLPPRGDKIPDVFKLQDGATIQWRQTSKTSGETIDIATADDKRLKVHIDG